MTTPGLKVTKYLLKTISPEGVYKLIPLSQRMRARRTGTTFGLVKPTADEEDEADKWSVAEKEYVTAKVIKFTYLDSCIGVVGRKGDDLTGVHLVMDIENIEFGEQADNVVQQIVDLLKGSDEVIIVGDYKGWSAEGSLSNHELIVTKLCEKLNAVRHKRSESGYWVVGPWWKGKRLIECAQLTRKNK